MKRWQRFLIIALAVAAAFALGTEAKDQLGFSFSVEGLTAFQQWVSGLGWLGPVVFVTMVTFRTFLGLSSHVVLILGGLAFGGLGGTLWGSLGLLISAHIYFFVAQLLGEDWVRPRLGDRYAAMTSRIERFGAGAIFIITAHPVGLLTPANLAAGLVGLPVWKFTLASATGSPIRAGVYSTLGTAVLSLSPAESIWIGIGLLAVFALPLLIPSVRAWVFGGDTHSRQE